jgi:hypothetical protein
VGFYKVGNGLLGFRYQQSGFSPQPSAKKPFDASIIAINTYSQ